MDNVFILQHLHRLPSGEEDLKLIGVYRTELGAREAVARLSAKPGFSKLPLVVDFDHDDNDQGFHITEYKLDEDNWTSGYVTVLGDHECDET